MTKAIALILTTLVVAPLTTAAAQEIQAGPVTLDLTGRAQIQFSTTSIGDDELPFDTIAGTAFELRRIRFGTDFAYEDWLSGTIEADFAGGDVALTNGYVDVALAERFTIRAGQFKKPFGLFELTSSTKILTIESAVRLRGLESYLDAVPSEAQSLLDAGMYLGRDVGVAASGRVGRVAYSAGVFNGAGANETEALDSKAVAARLTVDVLDALVVGAGVSRQPTPFTDADGGSLTGTAWALDAELGGFRVPGPHVMAEVMGGDNAARSLAGALPGMLGAQAAVAWFVPRTGRVEGVEPVLRMSWADPDTDAEGDDGLLVTPGINLYFSGRNRLMLNGEFYVPAGGDLEVQYGLISQLQIYF